MGKMIKGLIVGMAVGAALGIAFDPISSKDKKAMKKKVENVMDAMR